MSTRHRVAGVVALLLGCSGGSAQSKQACTTFFTQAQNRIVCAEALFSDPRFHFTVSGLPPGNGVAIGGVVEEKKHYVTPYQPKPLPPLNANSLTPEMTYSDPAVGRVSSSDVRLAILGSENQSWVATGSLTLIPGIYTPGERKDSHKISKRCEKLMGLCTQAQLALHFEGTHRNLQTISYYGVGPVSPAIKHTFHYNDTYGNANARLPLTDHIVAEGGLQILKPDLPFTSDPLSVDKNFTPVSAPGLLSQPAFVHSDLALLTSPSVLFTSSDRVPEDNRSGPLSTPNHRVTFNNSLEYDWYAAPSDASNSFQQMLLKADEKIEFGTFIHRVVFESDVKGPLSRLHYDLLERVCGSILSKRDPTANNGMGNALLKVNQECTFGTLNLRGQLHTSYTGSGSTVPFYLQPTVGGSDINSQPSLRGFPNYRFRDRDTVFVQTEYSATIRDPVGIVLFYDAGTAGPTFSSLSFAHLRQDVGAGLTFRVQGRVAAQIYLAGGAGHGPLLNYNFTKFF